MIITLPKRNRLINKLFNTIKAADNMDELNKENLEYIVLSSFGKVNDYIVKIEKKEGKNGKEVKQDGQYITIETENQKKYIFFSYEYPTDTRNGYIMAKIPIAFRNYYFDDTTKSKSFEMFLLDVDYKYHNQIKTDEQYEDANLGNLSSIGTINNYNIFAYKLCKTFGIRILNENKLPFNLYANKKEKGKYIYRKNEIRIRKGFESIAQIKSMRDLLGSRNSENSGSYILEFEDSIVIYGKTFGNNGFEMVLMACAIGLLAKKEEKEVIFYQIKDTLGRDGNENRDAKPITQENIKIMNAFDIKVFDELRDYEENPDIELTEKKDSRNQLEFIKNLMHKFGNTDEKKCYLCDCTIQKLIIASHIQRVCDINKLDIPFNQRRAKAVDADNGLWLCANHDKLFEHGLIYFDEREMMISDKLTDEQIEYVRNITYKTNINEYFYQLPEIAAEDSDEYRKDGFLISSSDYNENMHQYLEIHKERVTN